MNTTRAESAAGRARPSRAVTTFFQVPTLWVVEYLLDGRAGQLVRSVPAGVNPADLLGRELARLRGVHLKGMRLATEEEERAHRPCS